MINKCVLNLDNYTDHYKNGQIIIGHVLCTFDSPKQVLGIFVKVKGEAKTSWNETETTYNSSSNQNESHLVAYIGSDLILNDETDLLKCGGAEKTIPKGVHKYPFTYTLPKNIPSSYKHKLGKIKYKIKVVVKRPLLKFNYEAESEICVVTPVDLNEYPSLQAPLTKFAEKYTHCCCWKNGNIKITANITKAAYVISEVIHLHIQVENLSRTNIQLILCKVKKDTKFKVTSPGDRTRHDKVNLYTYTYSGVGAHGENTYDETIDLNNESILSNYIDCDIITNSYEIELTLIISGLHRKLRLELPFMVGHIPHELSLHENDIASINLPQEEKPLAYGFVQPPPYDLKQVQATSSATNFEATAPSAEKLGSQVVVSHK